jgi:DNA-binding protein HU-beta
MMNKAEIIEKMAEDAEIPKSVASKAFESFLDGVMNTLKDGGKVSVSGFGTFSVADRKARKARNPRTGEVVDVKASRAPKFAAAKAFKEYL